MDEPTLIGDGPRKRVSTKKAQGEGKTKDGAMNADELTPGGIDLNAKTMDLEVSKDGQGVEMKFDHAMEAEFQQEDLSGVVPIIIRVIPLQSPLSIFSLSKK